MNFRRYQILAFYVLILFMIISIGNDTVSSYVIRFLQKFKVYEYFLIVIFSI